MSVLVRDMFICCAIVSGVVALGWIHFCEIVLENRGSTDMVQVAETVLQANGNFIV